jgi:hypothetical protein
MLLPNATSRLRCRFNVPLPRGSQRARLSPLWAPPPLTRVGHRRAWSPSGSGESQRVHPPAETSGYARSASASIRLVALQCDISLQRATSQPASNSEMPRLRNHPAPAIAAPKMSGNSYRLRRVAHACPIRRQAASSVSVEMFDGCSQTPIHRVEQRGSSEIRAAPRTTRAIDRARGRCFRTTQELWASTLRTRCEARCPHHSARRSFLPAGLPGHDRTARSPDAVARTSAPSGTGVAWSVRGGKLREHREVLEVRRP